MEELSSEELAEIANTLEGVASVVKKASEGMEEISLEELDEVMRAPQSKPRKSKVLERSYHNWFYETKQSYGECENPDCIDPRGTDTAMVAEANGAKMCRFCFLAGWKFEET